MTALTVRYVSKIVSKYVYNESKRRGILLVLLFYKNPVRCIYFFKCLLYVRRKFFTLTVYSSQVIIFKKRKTYFRFTWNNTTRYYAQWLYNIWFISILHIICITTLPRTVRVVKRPCWCRYCPENYLVFISMIRDQNFGFFGTHWKGRNGKTGFLT